MGFFIEAITYGMSEANERKLSGRNNPAECVKIIEKNFDTSYEAG